MRFPAKFVNLGMLILGFGLGQGSLFAANTLLYWNGHYGLVAEFGAANAFVTLAYFVCDWGGLVYLAKESVMRAEGRRPVETSYLALGLVRTMVAALFVAGFYIQQIDQPASFFGEYSRLASLGLFAYAFNANGLLDGSSRAGISGLTQALPVVSAALALPFCVAIGPIVAGRVLGIVYALSMAAAISIQFLAMKFDWHRARHGLSPTVAWAVACESLPYMLTPLPGHALFRAQVYLATAFLSPQLTALFIYARQIVGVGYQGLGFFLRVDLVDFAERLAHRRPTARQVLLQSAVIRYGALGTLLLAAGTFLLAASKPELAHGLFLYSPCILLSAIATTLQRVFLLQSRGAENVIILVFSALTSFALMYPFASTPALWPLVLMEALSQILQGAFFIGRWRLGVPR